MRHIEVLLSDNKIKDYIKSITLENLVLTEKCGKFLKKENQHNSIEGARNENKSSQKKIEKKKKNREESDKNLFSNNDEKKYSNDPKLRISQNTFEKIGRFSKKRVKIWILCNFLTGSKCAEELYRGPYRMVGRRRIELHYSN